MAVLALVQFVVREKKIAEFKNTAQIAVLTSNQEPGCIFVNLHQHLKHKNQFIMFGKWKSASDFDVHVKSSHVQVFFGALERNEIMKEIAKTFNLMTDGIFNVENNNTNTGKNAVYIFAKLGIHSDKADSFIGAAHSAVLGTNQEDGNLMYNLHRDVNDENTFFFIEKWKSFVDLGPHQQTAHFKEFNRKVIKGKFSRSKPEIIAVSGPLFSVGSAKL